VTLDINSVVGYRYFLSGPRLPF